MKDHKKVGFVSLGCPKNLVDSEVMLGILSRHDYKITNEHSEADVIIINTCGFIESAKKESIDTIIELAGLKETGNCKLLVVAGCLPQRYQEELTNELPEVDLWIGTGEYHKIVEYLEKEEKGSHLIQSEYIYDDLTPRLVSTPKHTAYIKIAEGCSHTCTFCAIPGIRGRFRSRPVDSIIRETENLVSKGMKEAILIAQDTTSYGIDLKTGLGLPSLLKEMVKIKGLEWIRLLYTYPQFVTDELIDVIKNEDKVLKYLDIPIQHVSDRILKEMGRGITGDKLRSRLYRLREAIPDLTLRTSVIVGFPGEAEKDFTDLLNFIEEFEFDRLGAFTYSREEGTPASLLKRHIPENVKMERYNRVMALQKIISRKRNKEHIGRVEKVIVDGVSDESEFLLSGRTEGQAPDIDGITYITSGTVSPGDIVSVRIVDASDYDLVGEIV
ncbi:MAG: 30S ribosomal protein S12 methylthiotransferase RimO [Deltaproteobacteria bacterium]|nr:30S ribosomal protein S12 methylthiotransferase RimO [Deltaproteobacteria bacterium]